MRWEKWYDHKASNWWSTSVPCTSMGHYNSSYLFIPKSCDNTPVNMILPSTNKKPQLITNIMLLNKLHSAATAVGKDVSGFSASELGLHSICSGAAMSMYLTGIPVFMIMLIGCWSSNAFLRYITKQVQKFITGISVKMIQADSFFTISEALHEDPWVSGHYDNFVTRNNCGHDAQLDSVHPAFTLWT